MVRRGYKDIVTACLEVLYLREATDLPILGRIPGNFAFLPIVHVVASVSAKRMIPKDCGCSYLSVSGVVIAIHLSGLADWYTRLRSKMSFSLPPIATGEFLL